MSYDGFIAVDWSGDKNIYQKGIKVAILENKSKTPIIVPPPNNLKYWNRIDLVNYIKIKTLKKKYLIGFDFAFAYPYDDIKNYFPLINISPKTPYKLWELIEYYNKDEKNFYGGNIWNVKEFSEFYNAPRRKGKNFTSRKRLTEIYAKNICTPSSAFNCVGPGAVGTGSLAGMRVLNYFKNDFKIWPFKNFYNGNISTIVEIFPTLYFRKFNIKPEKNLGYTIEKINTCLKKYNCFPLQKNFKMYGPDQDEADAIISVAALKYFSKKKDYWHLPIIAKKEGWIYGVKYI